jgi:1,6-anhydro-N-acetylmuramate kinase
MLRDTSTTPADMSQLNVILGEMFADAVTEFCKKHAIDINTIDLIAPGRPSGCGHLLRFCWSANVELQVFGDGEPQALIDECLNRGGSQYDTFATITRITAENIVRQYRTFGPKEAFEQSVDIWMCGGGSLNPAITGYLQEQLPNARVLESRLDRGSERREGGGDFCLAGPGRSAGTRASGPD